MNVSDGRRGATADSKRAPPRVEREITLSPRVNGILMTMPRAEVRLTLAGLRWPLGGSRVVVARAV